jgi:hypothetical protein
MRPPTDLKGKKRHCTKCGYFGQLKVVGQSPMSIIYECPSCGLKASEMKRGIGDVLGRGIAKTVLNNGGEG